MKTQIEPSKLTDGSLVYAVLVYDSTFTCVLHCVDEITATRLEQAIKDCVFDIELRA